MNIKPDIPAEKKARFLQRTVEDVAGQLHHVCDFLNIKKDIESIHNFSDGKYKLTFEKIEKTNSP